MKQNIYFNIIVLQNILSLLYLLFVFKESTQQTIKKLDLYEGDICRRGKGSEPNFECQRAEKCYLMEINFRKQNYPDICMFDGHQPIFCCLSNINSIANDKCRQYGALFKKTFACGVLDFTCLNGQCLEKKKVCDGVGHCQDEYEESDSVCKFGATECIYNGLVCNGYTICKDGSDEKTSTCENWHWEEPKDTFYTAAFNGIKTLPQEFPHMALLGFGESIDEVKWACGGSLISEKWVLSAAHCHQMGIAQIVNWVRLGDLNIVSTTDDARPLDYKIVEHVIHPEYKKPSHYNDIALFRLEEEVKFSQYVWPICLNSDPSVDPEVQLIATGWGRTSAAGPTSDHLLKVNLHILSENQCNASYYFPNNRKLKFGITYDSMICANSPVTKEDTCQGDSGGPLQIKNNDFTNMYTQIGVTSFGKNCGDGITPGVYTRVSKYISWIEEIVWPVN